MPATNIDSSPASFTAFESSAANPFSSPVRVVHRDLRLEDAAVAARWTLPRFGELVFVEREAARPAARRHDDDAVAGRARGADHMTQGVLDVGARQAHLAREAGNRSRLTRQYIHQLFSEGHPPRLTAEDAENAETTFLSLRAQRAL